MVCTIRSDGQQIPCWAEDHSDPQAPLRGARPEQALLCSPMEQQQASTKVAPAECLVESLAGSWTGTPDAALLPPVGRPAGIPVGRPADAHHLPALLQSPATGHLHCQRVKPPPLQTLAVARLRCRWAKPCRTAPLLRFPCGTSGALPRPLKAQGCQSL